MMGVPAALGKGGFASCVFNIYADMIFSQSLGWCGAVYILAFQLANSSRLYRGRIPIGGARVLVQVLGFAVSGVRLLAERRMEAGVRERFQTEIKSVNEIVHTL